MALVIEDGSIVSGSNSYITDAEFTAYADARGKTYPSTAALREPLIIKSMDYIDALEFVGYRSEPDAQLFEWPRHNAVARERVIDSNEIPREVKKAQNEAALAAIDQVLQVNAALENVQSESLDVMAASYFKNGQSKRIRLDGVYAALRGLLLDSSILLRV